MKGYTIRAAQLTFNYVATARTVLLFFVLQVVIGGGGFHSSAIAQVALNLETVSDEKLKLLLQANSAISIPIGLGFNRSGLENASLPVRCLYENIEIKIDEVPEGGLNPKAIFDKIKIDESWQKVSETSLVVLIDWEVKPAFYWREDAKGKKALCVHGQPVDGSYKDILDCLILFELDENDTRLIRQSFKGFGVFQFWADNAHREQRKLRLFVMSFVASTDAGSLTR